MNASIVSFAVAALLTAAGIYFALFGGNLGAGGIVYVRGWWWILIGLFLAQAALASMRGARTSRVLETMPVSECMATTIIPVPSGTTIAGFVAEMAQNGRSAAYPVVNDGRFVGLVTLQDVAVVPHDLWQQTPITAIMTSSQRLPGLPPLTPACEALASLDEHHLGELPVFDDGALTGVVSKQSIFTALRAREKARPA
jgi:CBS domain-containing protein